MNTVTTIIYAYICCPSYIIIFHHCLYHDGVMVILKYTIVYTFIHISNNTGGQSSILIEYKYELFKKLKDVATSTLLEKQLKVYPMLRIISKVQ